MPTDNRLSRMLHVLIHMDRQEGPVTSEAIARMLSTNPVVVRRTLAGRRDDGYVTSEKGHGGGWMLARPLGDITLLDIYRALDRPDLFAIGIADDHGGCLVEAAVNARIESTLDEARTLLLTRFAQVSLADIADDFERRLAGSGHSLPDEPKP